MTLELSKADRDQAIASIQRYFQRDCGCPLRMAA
jgi:hypothetical protein